MLPFDGTEGLGLCHETLDEFGSRLISLSSLWVALNCKGLGRGRHADSDWTAFEREIPSLSRDAVGVLNDSLDRQNRLQEIIRLEADLSFTGIEL
jgi:hypothetical protein